METATQYKQELIKWIRQLDNADMLETLKSLKKADENTTDWWDEIPKAAKESIRRGEEDIKAGRVYANEDFWENIKQFRDKKNI